MSVVPATMTSFYALKKVTSTENTFLHHLPKKGYCQQAIIPTYWFIDNHQTRISQQCNFRIDPTTVI